MEEQVLQRDRDNQFVKSLELIQMSGAHSNTKQSQNLAKLDYDETDRRYEEAFRQAGIDFDEEAESIASKIKSSNVREDMITAVDHWMRIIPTSSVSKKINAWNEIGRWDQTARAYRKMVADSPGDSNVWSQLAVSLLGQRHPGLP